ncbi:MAG: 30S ribosomal protein S6 [Candidatus Peregrinibacteria bacterium]|nr:30S ribosomal protein S6 [Candidatus Peregrinibacteria bacterium]
MSDVPNEIENRGAPTIYEVGYLILPTVTEEELPREVTALKDVLEKEKAAPIAEEFPRFKPLAYPIHKRIAGVYVTFSNAYFGWVKFESTPDAIKKIENALKQAEKVLRFLLIKTVREQTMSAPRAPRGEFRRERKDEGVAAVAAPSAPVSEAELEKSLEKLIAE